MPSDESVERLAHFREYCVLHVGALVCYVGLFALSDVMQLGPEGQFHIFIGLVGGLLLGTQLTFLSSEGVL